MTHKISQTIIFCLLISFLLTHARQASAEGSFKISGAHQVTIESATTVFNFNKYAKVWMLQIRSPSDYKKKNGQGYSVNLFFSRDFTPAKGTFPIKFSYLSKKDTLGGSLTLSGKERGMFSHDTEGTVSFETFDTQVRGKFELSSFSGDSSAGAPRITATGTFDVARGEALPKNNF
jgi:hypothetical protein